MQNRNQSDDQTVEQQRKLVAARRKHVGELAAKVRSARRQKRIDVVRDERRELLSAAKEYLWQKQKLDGMMPSDEQAEYADAFDMWGQVEEIDTKVAELNSKPASDVMAVLARDDAISKWHEKRANLLQIESSEIEPDAQASPATEQIPSSVPVQPEQTPAPATTALTEPEQHPIEQPEPTVAQVASPQAAPSWSVNEPKRGGRYREPLYRFLLEAWNAGKSRPTARDVIDAWSRDKPQQIGEVEVSGFFYFNSKGETDYANLEAVRAAINRMTSAHR